MVESPLDIVCADFGVPRVKDGVAIEKKQRLHFRSPYRHISMSFLQSFENDNT